MSDTKRGYAQSMNKRAFRNWAGEHNPKEILGAFTNGKITPNEAIKRFENSGKNGFNYAARIAIEQASLATNIDDKSEYLVRAEKNFKETIAFANNHVGYTHLKAEAKLGIAQFPINGCLALTNEMPPFRSIKIAYRDTAISAHETAIDFTHSKYQSHSEAAVLIGNISETAVLLLGQRYAIRHIGDNSWLPVMSKFSEDKANGPGTTTSRAWDITLLTNLNGTPEASAFLQVKSSNRHFEHKLIDDYSDNITLINFNPMLRLHEDSGLSQIQTINDIIKEMHGNSRASEILDMRTELLLDIVG